MGFIGPEPLRMLARDTEALAQRTPPTYDDMHSLAEVYGLWDFVPLLPQVIHVWDARLANIARGNQQDSDALRAIACQSEELDAALANQLQQSAEGTTWRGQDALPVPESPEPPPTPLPEAGPVATLPTVPVSPPIPHHDTTAGLPFIPAQASILKATSVDSGEAFHRAAEECNGLMRAVEYTQYQMEIVREDVRKHWSGWRLLWSSCQNRIVEAILLKASFAALAREFNIAADALQSEQHLLSTRPQEALPRIVELDASITQLCHRIIEMGTDSRETVDKLAERWQSFGPYRAFHDIEPRDRALLTNDPGTHYALVNAGMHHGSNPELTSTTGQGGQPWKNEIQPWDPPLAENPTPINADALLQNDPEFQDAIRERVVQEWEQPGDLLDKSTLEHAHDAFQDNNRHPVAIPFETQWAPSSELVSQSEARTENRPLHYRAVGTLHVSPNADGSPNMSAEYSVNFSGYDDGNGAEWGNLNPNPHDRAHHLVGHSRPFWTDVPTR